MCPQSGCTNPTPYRREELRVHKGDSWNVLGLRAKMMKWEKFICFKNKGSLDLTFLSHLPPFPPPKNTDMGRRRTWKLAKGNLLWLCWSHHHLDVPQPSQAHSLQTQLCNSCPDSAGRHSLFPVHPKYQGQSPIYDWFQVLRPTSYAMAGRFSIFSLLLILHYPSSIKNPLSIKMEEMLNIKPTFGTRLLWT